MRHRDPLGVGVQRAELEENGEEGDSGAEQSRYRGARAHGGGAEGEGSKDGTGDGAGGSREMKKDK